MKVMAINGSPRKKWNTAMLLEKALEGAASQGAETELYHLYDLEFKGCVSCFSCKTIGGKSYGRCAVKDSITPILKKAEEVDIIILGSPIYFFNVTGEMRSFLERLMFPYLKYTDPPSSLFPNKIRMGFIYTMNLTEELMKEYGYDKALASLEYLLDLLFGSLETLYSFDTYQFKDYSKVFAERFDPELKARRRKEIFPKDLEKAFEMGARFVGKEGAET